jgi:transcription antitermination protein NusB
MADAAEEALEEPQIPDNRRGARQFALLALYWCTTKAGDLDQALMELRERFELSKAVGDFAAQLARKAEEDRERLEGLVAETATNWRPERLARVDALILRLALAEMLHFGEIPVRVSIDEAVELAKLYGGDRSHAFVNGVLDAIARRRSLDI